MSKCLEQYRAREQAVAYSDYRLLTRAVLFQTIFRVAVTFRPPQT